jgi:N-methylhydantoinase A
MRVRGDLARAAIDRLAARLGMDALATAEGIIAVVTANMARAIRVISVQRGHDPRDYTLVAFGGAGPLHVARLAAELEIRRVLVPRSPGILCAMGLLMADLRVDFAVMRLMALSPAKLDEVEAMIVKLRQRCEAWFAERAERPSRHDVSRHALCRSELRAFCAATRRSSGARDDRWACRRFCRPAPAALRFCRRPILSSRIDRVVRR